MKSVTTLNQTLHLIFPVVSRSRVTPKEIFENVEAKHEIEAPIDVQRAMVKMLLGSMSTVRFPKPSTWPTWVKTASMNSITWGTSVRDHCQATLLLTHENMRIQSSHHKPCLRLSFAYMRNPKNPPQRNVNHHVIPTIKGPLSGIPIIAMRRLAQPCSLKVGQEQSCVARIYPRSCTEAKYPEEDHSAWGRKRNMILPMGPRAVQYMGLNTWNVRHAS
jgi:hypothetical protein